MSQLYEAQLALERAGATLNESAHDLTGGFPIATANRAYYSIFYCLVSLLYTEGIQTKRHSGAQGKFHELFVRTADFPTKPLVGYNLHFNSGRRAIMIWKQTFQWKKPNSLSIRHNAFTH